MKTFHLSQNLRGALKNWDKETWKMVAEHNSVSVSKMKNLILDEIAKGRKVIRIGECDNFCYEKGCLGHKDEK